MKSVLSYTYGCHFNR